MIYALCVYALQHDPKGHKKTYTILITFTLCCASFCVLSESTSQ